MKGSQVWFSTLVLNTTTSNKIYEPVISSLLGAPVMATDTNYQSLSQEDEWTCPRVSHTRI